MISFRKEFEIKARVDQILKNNNITSPPIDLGKILKKEEISYYEKDLSILPLEGEVEAILLSQKNENKIVINTAIQEKYPGRKRFSIAHEIGHFFLHAQKGEPYIAMRNNYQELNQEEEEANKFASHLLMPDSMVEEFIFKENGITVKKLSEIFDVSERAMSKKILELGLELVG